MLHHQSTRCQQKFNAEYENSIIILQNMNENFDLDFETAAAVAEVERAALAPKTRERYSSSNYQYILWLMQHRPQLVHPELVEEVEEMTMSPILTPIEKKNNIRDRIKKVWLGETYNGMRNPVRCDLLTYDDVVGWYIEQKEPGTNMFKYGKQWFVGNLSALMYLFRASGVTMSLQMKSK